MVAGSLLLLLVRDLTGVRLPGFLKMFRGEVMFDFGGNSVRQEGEERIENEITELDVNTISGSIVITGWNESHTLVKWLKTAPTQEALDDLVLKIEARGKKLTAKPESSRRLAKRGSVSFEIYVPLGLKYVSAKSVSGSIRLTGIPGGIDQELGTTSGAIETDNAADLAATSVSGSVVFTFSGKDLQVETVSGSIRGDMPAIEANGSVKIGSVSGSVRLAVFQGIDARVDLHSVSGSVASELPVSVTQSKRNRLEGTIGDGTVPLEIGTTSGSIRITKL
jgi:DUF4097 and DUF4098 domain-containing protein YvlB